MNFFTRIFGGCTKLKEENAQLKQQLVDLKLRNQELIDRTNSYWKAKVHELNQKNKDLQKQK